jgi:hypothetical protein
MAKRTTIHVVMTSLEFMQKKHLERRLCGSRLRARPVGSGSQASAPGQPPNAGEAPRGHTSISSPWTRVGGEHPGTGRRTLKSHRAAAENA